jgi:hypothetical protein
MHSDDVRRLLNPRPGNLVHRLSGLESDEEVINELFLCVLSRNPSLAEKADVLKYLQSSDVRRIDCLANLTWAVLTSTEFMVNH